MSSRKIGGGTFEVFEEVSNFWGVVIWVVVIAVIVRSCS